MNFYLTPRNGQLHRPTVDPFTLLQDEINRLFHDDFWNSSPGGSALAKPSFAPRMDIRDTGAAYEVNAELPGVAEADVDVSLESNVLILKGEKKAESECKDATCYRTERSFGSFQRSVELPAAVDESRVEATFNQGVLRIVLPKKEIPAARKISIRGES